jgi:proline iminopeptidase
MTTSYVLSLADSQVTLESVGGKGASGSPRTSGADVGFLGFQWLPDRSIVDNHGSLLCCKHEPTTGRPACTHLVPRLVLLLALVFTACSNPTVTTPREITADSNGLALHVRVAGDPTAGNVLIAIHGGPGMTSDYMLSLEQLAGPDLAVVTYDQRGVGRSASPQAVPASYTLDRYAEDLDAVRKASGAERVDLFGHSWGGIVAMRYATLYPERVRSMVLLGSGPPARKQVLQCQDAVVQRIIALAQQGVIVENPQPGSPEAARGYLPAYFSDPNFWFAADDPGSAPPIDERTAQVNDLTWTANDGYDLTIDLAAVSSRVLNLWGDDDPCRPIASPAIITVLPNAAVETVVLSRCGHFWHECPEQFFAAVQAFLARAATAR